MKNIMKKNIMKKKIIIKITKYFNVTKKMKLVTKTRWKNHHRIDIRNLLKKRRRLLRKKNQGLRKKVVNKNLKEKQELSQPMPRESQFFQGHNYTRLLEFAHSIPVFSIYKNILDSDFRYKDLLSSYGPFVYAPYIPVQKTEDLIKMLNYGVSHVSKHGVFDNRQRSFNVTNIFTVLAMLTVSAIGLFYLSKTILGPVQLLNAAIPEDLKKSFQGKVFKLLKRRLKGHPIATGVIVVGGIIIVLCFTYHNPPKPPRPGNPIISPIADICQRLQDLFLQGKIEALRPGVLKEMELDNVVMSPYWPTVEEARELGILDEENRVIGFICDCLSGPFIFGIKERPGGYCPPV
uniref:Uncharacterized protein n=1 Tax=Colacium vesiculosum TaxID=102910 RepID=I6NIS0_9EUGL|nr:hypothetical protein [Colacium vesiculosum]